MLKRVRGIAATLLLSIGIGGCYSTDEPVLDKGEWAPLAGKFSCEGLFGRNLETFGERKDGLVFASYAYVDHSGNELKLQKVSGSLHLAQIASKSQGIVYAYVDFLDKDHYVLLAADLMSKAPYILNLSQKHGIREGKRRPGADPGMINWAGPPTKIHGFLLAHDKSLLMAVGDCKRQA